jgi:hypothetical protein
MVSIGNWGEGRTAAVTYFGANTTGIEKVVQPTGNTEDYFDFDRSTLTFH